ncbi:hypothetical protein RJ641_017485 [Dillenia turbinata]|uniref:Uncharacterized protein n=1 Tax=Dillenia turbinata TaxID=194707 RepID=A0AAN8V0F8_9MAGN
MIGIIPHLFHLFLTSFSLSVSVEFFFKSLALSKMERPLLEEGSGQRNRQTAFKRRTEAIAYGSPYQKAAALVDLAEDGIGLPEQILEGSGFASAAKLYFIYIKFDFLWSLNYFALVLINFLEKPLWCYRYTAISCEDREYFFLGQLPYLTGLESLVFEVLTLLILIIHNFFPILYQGWELYWRSPLNKLKVVLLLILVADISVYALFVYTGAIDSLPFRIAPYIRVAFFVLNIRYV